MSIDSYEHLRTGCALFTEKRPVFTTLNSHISNRQLLTSLWQLQCY